MKRYIYTLMMLFASIVLLGQVELSDYLKTAAEHNPSLKSKFSLYLAALEKVDQSGALPDPTVSFGYFISPVETRVGAQRFKVSLSQMFPWKGTLKAREQVATSIAKVRFEEFQEAKNQLFLNVKLKWLELYELRKEVEIMEANLDILRSYEPTTKTKYEANLVSLTDLIRVQISIDNAKTQLDLLKLKEVPLIGDFNTMLNRDLASKVVLQDTLSFAQVSMSRDSAIANQPKIKGIRAGLESLSGEMKLADLKRKPNLGVGLDYAFVSKRNDVSIPDNGKDILMPMATISLPIFGKKNRSFKREVQYKTESLESKLVAVENDLKNDWTKADYEMEMALKELNLFTAEAQKTEVLLNVLISEYSNNHREFEKLLETQQRQLQLELQKMKSSVKYHKAVFMKDYLMGYTLKEVQNENK